MKITRHLHYIQNPDLCVRYELTFDPPVDVESTLGEIDAFYLPKHFTGEGTSNRLERTANMINNNGLLHIKEVMAPGEVISMDIMHGFRLDQIVKADENELQVFVRDTGLTYAFTIGKIGVFQVTGKVIKDDDGFYRDLKADLTDVSMREYVVRHSLADIDAVREPIEANPGIMNHKQAADYLNLSPATLYNIKEIPRLKHNRYRKDDLDSYMEGKPGKKRRR